MNVEYIYDAKTQALISKFKRYLADYETMLMDKINNNTVFENMSVTDLQSSKRQAFLGDQDRIELEAQLAKIYAQAIPEKVVFSETANADS